MEKLFNSKREIRKFVWKLLKNQGVARFPCEDHIPNFRFVEESVKRLIELEIWKNAKTIFVSPDTPQRLFIKYGLSQMKRIIMATPRLRHGFVAVTRYSPRLNDILKNAKPVTSVFVDLAIIGSVAVDLKGNRIGKGGGYGDREIKMLRDINNKVIIATNVHDLQVFKDFSYLMEPHDEKVDVIVTPNRVISCRSI